MKKYILFLFVFFLGIGTIYAISTFQMDTTKFSFTDTIVEEEIKNAFHDYELTYQFESEHQELLDEISTLSRNITYLLLKKEGSSSESALQYNQRYKKYLTFRYSPEIPKINGEYDKNSQEYNDDVMSGLVVPTMFRYLDELGIRYTNISAVRVIASEEMVLSAVYVPSVTMKMQNPKNLLEYQEITTNLVLYYSFKKMNGEYKLYYLSGETSSTLSEYFNTVENKEMPKTLTVTSSYKPEDEMKNIYNYQKLDSISNNQKQAILNKNANSVVMLNSYYNNNLIASSHGFFLKKGILVTTWSYLEKSLRESQYLVIKDYQGNFYNLDGILTINSETDLAVLKLKEEVGVPVILSNEPLKSEDAIFMISSKSGIGYVLQSGINVGRPKYYQNLLPLLESDGGSPLLDKNGNVVAINISKSNNTSMSLAVPKETLQEVLEKIEGINFQNLKVKTFQELKEKYYYRNFQEEIIQKDIPNKVWKKYSQIGDIENTISLKLVKANYQDGIVSLRYQNEASDYLSNIQFSNAFRKQLKEDGYEEISRGKNRYVYQNKKYKVIIMDQFNYLIIVMVSL